MKKYACVVFIMFAGCLPKATLPKIPEVDIISNIQACNHEIAPLRFMEEK